MAASAEYNLRGYSEGDFRNLLPPDVTPGDRGITGAVIDNSSHV
jgi:hypothetical protein